MKKILSFFLVLCVISGIFADVACLADNSVSETCNWDYFELQSYSKDHSNHINRGNWYNCDEIKNFTEVGFEKCKYSGNDLRSLKLSLTAENDNILSQLMFVNLYDSDKIASAKGMRFRVANPSEKSVNIGITYCDTDAIYSCHKDAVYYLETNGKSYRKAPKSLWNEFVSNGPNDVGIIEIPSGFSGYIYLPFSSTTRGDQFLKFKRVRLFLGCTTGLTSNLYLESIGYYSTNIDFSNSISEDYSFDASDVVPASNAGTDILSSDVALFFSTEIFDGSEGKALKAVFKKINTGYGYTQLRLDGLWGKLYDSGSDGLRFFVCNPSENAVELRVQFGDNYLPCNMNSVYYITDDKDTVTRKTTTKAYGENIGCITIPGKYNGFVMMPYSLTIEKNSHLILSAKSEDENCTLFFDTFEPYKNSEYSTIKEQMLGNIEFSENSDTQINYSRRIASADAECKYQIISLENNNKTKLQLEIKSAVEYYIEYSNGILEEHFAEKGIITIPADFVGKIYIPLKTNEYYSLTALKTDTSAIINCDYIGVYKNELYPTGDVNEDTDFDIRDLVSLKKHLSDFSVKLSSDKADLNSDQTVNSKDLALLRKSLLCGVYETVSEFVNQTETYTSQLKIHQPLYSDAETIIAEADVIEFGADPTGISDSTPAVKAALEYVSELGGGTVYIPEGNFRITETINIPEAVSICGEWRSPEDGKSAEVGTIFLADNDAYFINESVLTMNNSSCISNITVIYPNQHIETIKKYYYTISMTGYRCFTIKNITVLGAWNGIELGNTTTPIELYYLNNVYISSLNIGISNDRTGDIGRMETVVCSPEFWCGNAMIPFSAEEQQRIYNYTVSNAHGMEFYLNDWSIASDIVIKNQLIGMYFGISDSGTGMNGKFLNVAIDGCKTGILLDKTKIGGVDFTNLSITSNTAATAGIDTGTEYSGICMFQNAKISGDFRFPIRNQGISKSSISGTLKFLSGEITNYNAADNWAVNVGGGSVVMEGMTIAGWRHHIWIYNSIQSVLMLGCKFGGEFNSSVLSSETENFIISDSEVSLELPSGIETPSYDTKKSEKVVSVLDFGASVYADDNTNAFQAAMNSLNENGGTVYVPAGNWRFSGQIVIPKNVELRGATPMQTMQNSECRKGTILWSFYSDGNDETPFIIMSDDSTVNGITVYYDQQVSSNAASYPCTISVNGSSCRILNIVLTNSYNGIDIATNKADGYIIDFVSGAPINYGISVRANTQNGIIKNCHFNPNYAYILTHNSADPNYRLYNGTAYLFGNCKNKNIYGIFAYGYKNGIEFSSQNGNGADIRLTNCSVDGSETSMRISSAANVEVINGQYVSMASENEKHGIITESNFTGNLNVYNSNIWGPSDYLLFLSGGNCNFHLVNLCTGNVDYSIYMNSGSAKFNLITFHNNNILINGKNTYADFVFCNLRTYKSTIRPSSENNPSVNQSYCYWN